MLSCRSSLWRIVFASSLLFVTHHLSATAYCAVDKLVKFTFQQPLNDQLVHLTADNTEATKTQVTLSGNIEGQYLDNYFTATQMMIDKDTDDLTMDGEVVYGQPQFALRAQSGNYKIRQRKGEFNHVEYYLSQTDALGSADQISFDRKANWQHLKNATYTTCERDNPTWKIGASELHLDHDSGIGYAKNPSFYLGETKVFAFPYFSFALDDKRKSGFLYPSFALTQQRGLQTDIPYYFNIAPNFDDTLTTRLMSKRGVMFMNEFRYLFNGVKGTVETDYLPYDAQTGTRDDRWRFALRTEMRPRDDVFIDLLYQRVSDGTYFNELEDNLDLIDESFLESHLNVHYHPIDNIHVLAQWEQYQLTNPSLAESEKPYERRPRVQIDGDWEVAKSVTLTHSHEYVDFYKKNNVSGQRLHHSLELAYHYDTPSFFFTPKVKHQHTQYNLTNTSGKKGYSRSVPTFSADAGYRFEREFSWRGQDVIQTLEPRLFYLRTPYEKQAFLPNFDTERLDSSYDYLFLDDRFNGNDRIGDANQLTTAISSRILSKETGEELSKVAIGQIHYFDDRQVSLGDSLRDPSPRSELIIESSTKVTEKLSTRSLWHGSLKGGTERRVIGAQYLESADKLINLYYLYDKNYYEQADLSGVWRINDNWRSFWRYNHSIRQDKTIDALFGLEYGECCGAIRFALRQHRPQSLNEDLRTAFYLEFSLKGLGDIGLQRDSQLEKIIPGYQKTTHIKQNER